MTDELGAIKRELAAAAHGPGGLMSLARIRVTTSAVAGSIVRVAVPRTWPGVAGLSEIHVHPDDWPVLCEQADQEPRAWDGSVNRDKLLGIPVIHGDESS
jgi:hypothetical protein